MLYLGPPADRRHPGLIHATEGIIIPSPHIPWCRPQSLREQPAGHCAPAAPVLYWFPCSPCTLHIASHICWATPATLLPTFQRALEGAQNSAVRRLAVHGSAPLLSMPFTLSPFAQLME